MSDEKYLLEVEPLDENTRAWLNAWHDGQREKERWVRKKAAELEWYVKHCRPDKKARLMGIEEDDAQG